MVFGRIYCATSKTSGKKYVGQSIHTIEERFRGHVHSAMRQVSEFPFHRAVRLYGPDDFEVTLLEECDSIDSLNFAETKWIAELGTLAPHGYNCTTGGEGFVMSEETKQRIRESRVGMKLSDAHRQHISDATSGEKNSFWNRHHTSETIEKIVATCREQSAGEKNPFYGKKHTDESRIKISEAARRREMHPKTREAIRKANTGNCYTKGRKLTITHREKLSVLTVGDVLYIKRNPDELSTSELAKKLGVKYQHVYWVKTGRTWRGVEP